jgi:hypothetical protein
MNKPTDDDDGDVHDVNINLNFSIVTPTKKASKKIPTKATPALNVPTTKEKTRVAYGPTMKTRLASGPTMNQPTAVDSTDVDSVNNIVTPTKKATKKIPTKESRATKDKARVDFGPTMNQPTVDSTVDTSQDVHGNTSQDVGVKVSVVTPTKRVKKSTKAARALRPPKTKERVNVTRRLCRLCHQPVPSDRLRLSCKVCHSNFCKMCYGKGLMVIPFFCTLCFSEVCDECAPKCERCGESECNDCFPHHICEAE